MAAAFMAAGQQAAMPPASTIFNCPARIWAVPFSRAGSAIAHASTLDALVIEQITAGLFWKYKSATDDINLEPRLRLQF
jgi:hypothetical protein